MTMTGRVVVVLVGLLLAAGLAARADRSEEAPLRSSFATFQMTIGEWQGIQQPAFSSDVLRVLGLNDYLTRIYAIKLTGVDLYVGYWQSQRQGDAIHSPLNCLPGSGWEPVARSIVTLPGFPEGATVNRVIIQNGIDRQLVLYWYQSHGRVVASEYWSKFYLAADAIRWNRTDGSIVRIVAPMARDDASAEQAADATATRFATVLLPALDGFLPR
jgi:EpsI family protein